MSDADRISANNNKRMLMYKCLITKNTDEDTPTIQINVVDWLVDNLVIHWACCNFRVEIIGKYWGVGE